MFDTNFDNRYDVSLFLLLFSGAGGCWTEHYTFYIANYYNFHNIHTGTCFSISGILGNLKKLALYMQLIHISKIEMYFILNLTLYNVISQG